MEKPMTITVTVNDPWDALAIVILEQVLREANGEPSLFLDDELGFLIDRLVEVAIGHNTEQNRRSKRFAELVDAELADLRRIDKMLGRNGWLGGTD